MPLRSCTGCGVVLEKGALLRFTWGSSQLELDLEQRREGRGVYLCNAGGCLDKATKRGQFSYRLRREVGPIDGQALRHQMANQIEEALFGVIERAKGANELRAVSRSNSAALQPGGEALALICPDVSTNRMKRLMRFCRNRSLPFTVAGNKEQFCHLAGRRSCSIIILKEGAAARKAKDLLLRLGQLSGGQAK